jgi:hypothetical protein
VNKWTIWRFWLRARKWVDRRLYDAWMEGGNCTSKCRRCKQWEHTGTTVKTEDAEDGPVVRTCMNCGYQFTAVFTPAGFIPVEGNDNAG